VTSRFDTVWAINGQSTGLDERGKVALERTFVIAAVKLDGGNRGFGQPIATSFVRKCASQHLGRIPVDRSFLCSRFFM
jgi:hypothetical protein